MSPNNRTQSDELPKYHSALWAAMKQFERLGYQVTYHHLKRDTLALHQLADLVASQSRGQILRIIREAQDTQAAAALVALEAQYLQVGQACQEVLAFLQYPSNSHVLQGLRNAAEALFAALTGPTLLATRAALAASQPVAQDPRTGQSILLDELNPFID